MPYERHLFACFVFSLLAQHLNFFSTNYFTFTFFLLHFFSFKKGNIKTQKKHTHYFALWGPMMHYFALCHCKAHLSPWGTYTVSSPSLPNGMYAGGHLTVTLVSAEWNSGTGQTGPPCTHSDRNAVSRRLISCHYKVVSHRLKNSSKVHTTGLYSFWTNSPMHCEMHDSGMTARH